MIKQAPTSPVESLHLVRAALRHRGLTDRERVVLAELASHDPSKFVPTLSVLARSLWGTNDRRHRDHARKMLRQLEGKGVVQVEYGEAGQVARYALNLGDAGPASAPKQLPKVTPAERQVTLRQRRGDAGSEGLSTKKNNQKNRKKKNQECDAQLASHKKLKDSGMIGDLPGPYSDSSAKTATLRPGMELNENSKQILSILQKSPAGMFDSAIAHSLGKNTIDLKHDFEMLREANVIHQKDPFKLGRFFSGPKDDAS